MARLPSKGAAYVFTIGEFSKITGLTIKTLRFYHEEGLLVPTFVDPQSGYRYYNESQIEVARVIAFLRKLEFPLNEIKVILRDKGDDEQLLEVMERQKTALTEKIKGYRKVLRSLQQFIDEERRVRIMAETGYKVQEKLLEPMLIAGVRMQGRYSECGKGFSKIGRSLGRYICGAALLLIYDSEYREENADFEACMPVRQGKEVDGVSVRELPGGRCVSLLHMGPYDQVGPSYCKILKYIKEKGYQIQCPSREVYLKGPGMIFKGNPKNYLTEIQMLIGTSPVT